MRELLALAGGLVVGYIVVARVIPTVHAKIEALDLDSTWELWDSEGWI